MENTSLPTLEQIVQQLKDGRVQMLLAAGRLDIDADLYRLGDNQFITAIRHNLWAARSLLKTARTSIGLVLGALNTRTPYPPATTVADIPPTADVVDLLVNPDILHRDILLQLLNAERATLQRFVDEGFLFLQLPEIANNPKALLFAQQAILSMSYAKCELGFAIEELRKEYENSLKGAEVKSAEAQAENVTGYEAAPENKNVLQATAVVPTYTLNDFPLNQCDPNLADAGVLMKRLHDRITNNGVFPGENLIDVLNAIQDPALQDALAAVTNEIFCIYKALKGHLPVQ